MNKQETIADIIAEMRALSNSTSDGIIAINGRIVADRLEAAWKREKAAIEADALFVGGFVEASRAAAEKSSVVGDCAKLREALKSVIHSMELEAKLNCTEKKCLGKFGQTQEDLCEGCRRRSCECWAMTLKRECEAALAAPPRNCDVGTAEEQSQRFRTFCESHFDNINCKCGDCPAKYCIDGWGIPFCQLKWAQMPYEEGGVS